MVFAHGAEGVIGVFLAGVAAVFAPGVEGAVAGPLGGHGRQAVDGNQHAVLGVVQPGNGPEQGPGVGVLGVVENFRAAAGLHDVAAVHDVDAFGVAGDEPQVVGDHDHGGIGLFRDVPDHLQELGLGGHVQGGGRLVGDQDVRTRGHGHGDHDALAHTAGELLGIIVVAGFGIGDVHHLHRFDGALLSLLRGHVFVKQNVFLNLIADGHDGVQAGHRLLEDHRDAAAADLAHLFAVAVVGQKIIRHAFQIYLSAGHAAGAGDQLEAREHGDGLARAALADDADDLAAVHVHADAFDGVELLSVGAEGGHQVFDFKQMLGTHIVGRLLPLQLAAQARVESVAHAVAQGVQADDQ